MTKPAFKRMAALFGMGILCGATGMMLWQSREFNRLYLQLSHLKMQTETLEMDNLQLTAQLQSPRQRDILYALRITVTAPEALLQVRVAQRLKERLSSLMGRPIHTFVDNPDLPAVLLDQTTLSVDDKLYVIRVVSTVIVDGTLYLHVRATPKP